ncbi:hypothetical protein CAP36_04955 [Chitinophagaceae bacterium IBVUCB2]|nr:hypothetical protein CAP36_04955 [Chitinophagaceae bacterium IBVUCB2]
MKRYTSLLLVFFLSFSVSFADEIAFEKNATWAEVKAKAKRENKMIFFDAYTAWCGPCKYLEKNVYTDAGVAAYYNHHYISVKFDMEKGEGIELAKEFSIDSYPTLLFFSADGKLVHKYIGATDVTGFISLGENAADPAKQYIMMKEQAAGLLLTDAAFAKWAFQADRLQDVDKGAIIRAYLAGKKDILSNKDVAITALLQAPELTEIQLSYLSNNPARIGELFNLTTEQITSLLYKRIFNQAMVVYQRSNQQIDSFSSVIKKYIPTNYEYAVKDLLFKEALRADKNISKATGLLLEYLDDRKSTTSIEAIAGWFEEFSAVIDKENAQRLINKLARYELQESDEGKEYCLYLIQMSCYTTIGDIAEAKIYALKAYQAVEIPAEYKDMLKVTWGFTD